MSGKFKFSRLEFIAMTDTILLKLTSKDTDNLLKKLLKFLFL